jgi:hypothetical protein
MTDELQARLQRADPAATGAPVHPADGPNAAMLRRTIMDTNDETLTNDGAPSRTSPTPWWRQPLLVGAVGAAAAAAVVITVVAVSSDDPSAPPTAATTVSYDIAGSDPISSSCLPVADIEPAPAAEALAGTVVSVDDALVVLDVERWYAGGDADRVELKGADQSVALDGVEFVVGEDYLVTATDGVVEVCGVSGPATPELEQLYAEWYG